MMLFLIGLVILCGGYFTYGKIVQRIVGPDDRKTPAIQHPDGVDYVVLPHYKNMLIQLLNIAGVGPVIGVIIGIKFGSIVFVMLPIGCIIGGAVHDFVSGMMSLRNDGANLPKLIDLTAGKWFYRGFSAFMIFLLLLVVAVFINVPANLIKGMAATCECTHDVFWIAVAVIFVYYILATLFPVDKIIGRFYPVFGALLLVGTGALFVMLLVECFQNPALLTESDSFKAGMFTAEKNMPILPMLFVTIACGILSGFHATQSPIIARTMATERQARASFYGMMVVEGFIGMVWAAAGLAIYNLIPETMSLPAPTTLSKITSHFLGKGVSLITVLSVVILSITSGDTAMRSLRLSLAEVLGMDQQKLGKRFSLVFPLIIIVAALLWWSNTDKESFGLLWNYFAWGNQVLAACTFLAATIWLKAQKKATWITLIPGVFILFIVLTYILWISPAHSAGSAKVVGLGLDLHVAYAVAVLISVALYSWAYIRGKRLDGNFDDETGVHVISE